MVTWPHSVDDIGGFLITWLPIIFFGIIIWLLLRTMALVPKVKPAMVERAHERHGRAGTTSQVRTRRRRS